MGMQGVYWQRFHKFTQYLIFAFRSNESVILVLSVIVGRCISVYCVHAALQKCNGQVGYSVYILGDFKAITVYRLMVDNGLGSLVPLEGDWLILTSSKHQLRESLSEVCWSSLQHCFRDV